MVNETCVPENTQQDTTSTLKNTLPGTAVDIYQPNEYLEKTPPESCDPVEEDLENVPPHTTLELYQPEDDCIENTDAIEQASFGDLYVLGKLWIDVLQTGLLGKKWKLPPILPVVEAKAPPPPPPKKPPKMKYKDLPLYSSPHHEYKDYLEDKTKCKGLKRKLIHEKILPHIKSNRKYIYANYTDFVTEARSMKKEALATVYNKLNEWVSFMRCGKNLRLRQGTVAAGGLAGFLLGRRFKDRLTPKIFYTAVGLIAAGALCFPRETDEQVRCISYCTGNFLITVYNKYCSKNFALRDRMPCKGDLPGPAPKRVPNKCPVKK